MNSRVITALAALSLVVSLEARDTRAHVDSAWITSPVTVDGSPIDWAGRLAPFNDQPLSMAAANDNNALYVVLTASDPAVRRQILRQGLIVWFDGGGKDKKQFGVKFPIGVGLSDEDLGGRRRGGPPDSARPGREAGDRAQAPPVEPPNRLEVLGAKKEDARSYTADQAPGIAVKVGQAEGLLTYELRVPLASAASQPYAVAAKPGQTISVGLEMPKLEMPDGRGREGGRGGGGGMERPEQAKPLSGWVEVKLAAR